MRTNFGEIFVGCKCCVVGGAGKLGGTLATNSVCLYYAVCRVLSLIFLLLYSTFSLFSS